MEGSSVIDLRQYTGRSFRIRGRRSDSVDVRKEVISFRTTDHADGWPAGPNVELVFWVRKKGKAVIATVALLLIAVLCGVGAKVSDANPALAMVLSVVAVACALGASLVYLGKIKVG